MNRTFIIACWALAACGSPIVGAECAEGYVRCGNQCVDLASNRNNCGSCGNVCELTENCVTSMCVSVLDGGLRDGEVRDGDIPDGFIRDGLMPDTSNDPDADVPDGGFPDGSLRDGDLPDGVNPDGAIRDGAVLDGDLPDGTFPDGVSPDSGTPMCSCDIGELCCEERCVQPDRDPRNCGECGRSCAVDEVCSSGSCEAICEDPLVLCGGLCINTQTDRDNCGTCGRRCSSGICRDGLCSTASEGHVVLIGHDYRVGREGQNYLAGNAAFIPFGSTVDVLVYEGEAIATAGVDAAIEQVAVQAGRSWTRTVAPTPDSVPLLLMDADVFVVYSQSGASNFELQALGTTWATAFMSFLRRGGVIIVFDGGGGHDGTWQLLDTAGLLDVGGRTTVTGDTLTVVDRGDAIARRVPLNYLGENRTVHFDAAPASTIVVEHPDGPVAIHVVLSP
ncbi:MAG: hypothetical protein ACI9KE_001646 [Polyangiales bacterium]